MVQLTRRRSPCEDATKASMDCMNRHNYDRDKCLDFFQAYRDCKKIWVCHIPSPLIAWNDSTDMILDGPA